MSETRINGIRTAHCSNPKPYQALFIVPNPKNIPKCSWKTGFVQTTNTKSFCVSKYAF